MITTKVRFMIKPNINLVFIISNINSHYHGYINSLHLKMFIIIIFIINNNMIIRFLIPYHSISCSYVILILFIIIHKFFFNLFSVSICYWIICINQLLFLSCLFYKMFAPYFIFVSISNGYCLYYESMVMFLSILHLLIQKLMDLYRLT